MMTSDRCHPRAKTREKLRYRVRHNSNTGTILTTTYKYKYFWRMYNSRTGVAEYGYRNDLQDGWILSNVELLNVALGRA